MAAGKPRYARLVSRVTANSCHVIAARASARLTGLLLLFFFRTQVNSNTLDGRIFGKFATLAIITFLETKSLREKV